MMFDPNERFSRQILLKELGPQGQAQIAKTRFLVVGAGGLGSPATMYLAASGALQITVADADSVSLSNLSRQLLHTDARIGMNKAQSAKIAIKRINPATQITPIEAMAEGDRLNALVLSSDIVLDCSDNFATRHAINRACHDAKVPLVTGATVRFDGQVTTFDFRDPHSACYRCLFEEDDGSNDVKAADVGVFSPITGLIGTIQAIEALKIATGIGTPLSGRLLLIDALTMDVRTILYSPRPHCPICANH